MNGEQWVEIVKWLAIGVWSWPAAIAMRAYEMAGNAEAWKHQVELAQLRPDPSANAAPLLNRVVTNIPRTPAVIEYRSDTERMQYRLPPGLTDLDIQAVRRAMRDGAQFSRRGLDGYLSTSKYPQLVNWLIAQGWAAQLPNNAVYLKGPGRALFGVER